MSDNQSWPEGETSRFTSDYTYAHVYMYRIEQEIRIFTLSRNSIMSVHRSYLLGEKMKFLAGFELAFSIILLEVLGLTHYTKAEDIVILLPL